VVENYENVRTCCSKMANKIVLENMVCDSQDPRTVVRFDFDPEVNDTPATPVKGSCPSPALFEKFFAERGFKIERQTNLLKGETKRRRLGIPFLGDV
jgi:hypothetical protein